MIGFLGCFFFRVLRAADEPLITLNDFPPPFEPPLPAVRVGATETNAEPHIEQLVFSSENPFFGVPVFARQVESLHLFIIEGLSGEVYPRACIHFLLLEVFGMWVM
jgi:hypothetical protein